MKTRNIFLFTVLYLLISWQGISNAEIQKIILPDVTVNPNLNSVLSQKNSVMPNQVSSEDTKNVTANALPETNGYILPGGNIIVDNPVEPKCVFYGNYNEGSGDAFQYLDVNTIVFECQ